MGINLSAVGGEPDQAADHGTLSGFNPEYDRPQEVVETGQVYDLDIIRPRFDDYKKEAARITTEAKALTVSDDETLNIAVMLGGSAKKISKAIDTKRKAFIQDPQEFVKGVNAICKAITDNLDEAERVTKAKISQHQARIEMERRKQEEAARKAAAELQAKLLAEAEEANRKAREEATRKAAEEVRGRLQKQKNIPANITAKDGLLWKEGRIIELPAADEIARQYGFNCAEEMVRELNSRQAEIEAAKTAAEEETRKHEIQAPTVIAPVIPETTKAVRTEDGSAHQRKVWSFEILDAAQVPVEYKIINEQAIRDAIKMGVRNISGVMIYEETKTVFRT